MTMERMKHLLPNDRMKVMQQDVFSRMLIPF